MDVMAEMLEDIEGKGWSVSSDLFPRSLCEELYEEARIVEQKGFFRAARIGQGHAKQHENSIRGDQIAWIEDTSPKPVLQTFLARLDEVRRVLNQRFFLSLNSCEAHFASYEQGSYYQKHVDQLEGRNHRIISMVLFLNTDWKDDDGGELVIYDPSYPLDVATVVLPRIGTLAIFRSGDVPHEVRAPQRTRYSIASWLRHDG